MNLDHFLPFIAVEVLGCSEPLMRQSLVRAATDFCQKTLAWSEIQEPIDLVENQREYDLEAPNGAEVYSVRDVWVNGRRIESMPLQRIVEMTQSRELDGSSEPRFYNVAADRAQLSVYPTPKHVSTQQLRLRVAYAPKFNTTTLPDFLGNQYLTAISAGAKSSLMAIPGQAWTNPGLAQYYASVFESGVVNGKSEALRDGVQGSIHVQPRAFGF